jgi:hypothetical protein
VTLYAVTAWEQGKPRDVIRYGTREAAERFTQRLNAGRPAGGPTYTVRPCDSRTPMNRRP